MTPYFLRLTVAKHAEEIWNPLDGVVRFKNEFIDQLSDKDKSIVRASTPFDKLVWAYYNYDEIQMEFETRYLEDKEAKGRLKVCMDEIKKYVSKWISQYCQVPFDPVWLNWNDGMAVRLAQAIRNDLGFNQLSILADALEEAGCTNEIILDHCRMPGPHVFDCWVLDLLLGKQ